MQDWEVFLQILKEPAPFAGSTEDEEACESLLSEFNNAEVEEIACVSYAYWNVRMNAKAKLPSDAQKISALKEIRRHYVGEGRIYESALAAVREALEYRRAYNVNAIRSCFYDSDADNREQAQRYKELILGDLEIQTMVVRGVDDQGRVIIYKPPRTSPGDDSGEAFLLTQLYTAERAMATNEYTSKGKSELLTVVFNFQDYSRKNTPPMSVTIQMLKLLQRCYPERLRILVIVHPPYWLRGAYNLVWPLLSTATAEKLSLPYSHSAVNAEFHKIVGGNKELEAMLANGDISSVDLNDYTQQPFYRLYEQTKQ